jgi:AraC-like DNA-binding protein
MMIVAAVTAGCTKTDKGQHTTVHDRQPKDTVYTIKAAMGIYGYLPERALQIVDSGVIVGNMTELQADQCRARIYCMSLMKERVDSLLGGPKDVCLDSARAIGERILHNDTIQNDLRRRQDVLEILAYTARMKKDTTGWMRWSYEIIDVCRQLGGPAETDALRTEAEVGAALYAMGRHEEGMAKLDHVIEVLSEKPDFKFNELDALIIALKRKMLLLSSPDQYAEILPLARRILERLDKYEKDPDAFHDGSLREPKTDEKRADYIHFYRSQALNHLTAAYASLGERGNMQEVFEKLERDVRNVTAREHTARLNALQQQMEAERQQAIADKAKQTAVTIGILALLFLVFAVAIIFQYNNIRRKNHVLAQQIAEAVKYKEKFRLLSDNTPDPSSLNSMTDEQLYQYIADIVVREHLFCDPNFGRETIMERFQLSKERVGTIFSKGSEHGKMSTYILKLRLDYAAQQLLERPDKTVVQIASDSGFSSSAYFTNCFRQQFGLTPTDYRREAISAHQP